MQVNVWACAVWVAVACLEIFVHLSYIYKITSLDVSPAAKLGFPLAMQLVCAWSVSCLQQGAMYVVIRGVVGASRGGEEEMTI